MLGLIETILKLAVQVFIFFVTLAVRIVSGILGALWSAFQNRAPRNAYQSPLAPTYRPSAKVYHHKPHSHKRRKQWRRR
ncbi:hypothetical protein ABIB06_006526 [Bradyrhizobium sp. LB8.2]